MISQRTQREYVVLVRMAKISESILLSIVPNGLMPYKVLVLDNHSAAGIETVQSLGQVRCEIHAACLRRENARCQSRFISRQIELPASNKQIAESLVDLFRAEDYDLIVPATEVSILAMLSPEIPDEMYRRAVLAPRESVRAALDKQAVWRLAQRLSVRVPSSKIVTPETRPPDAFPVVLKPVHSRRNRNGAVQDFSVTIARDLMHWQTTLALKYQDIRVQQQQYISGRGVGVEMLFESGTPRWVFLHERVHEFPLTGGGSSYRKSIELQPELVYSAGKLLSALDWHGVAMVEFKVTPSGEAYLMEINPRLWGSLALAVDCGVNFPVGLLCLSTGQPLPLQPKYRTGYFTRNIRRDVAWFKANLTADHSDPLLHTKPVLFSTFELLRPVVGKESWDFFSWFDSGVVCYELKAAFMEVWRGCVRVIKRGGVQWYVRHIEQSHMLRKIRRKKIKNVLFLCYGNICRSPLAAAVAAKRFPSVSFSSAGFYSVIGRCSPEFVCAAAEGLGVDLTGHRSNTVDAKMLNEAELVVIMDSRNHDLLKKHFPYALQKTLLLGMLLPEPRLEIRDPYDSPDSMPAIASEVNCAVERMGGFLI